jgi:hypothetical protein
MVNDEIRQVCTNICEVLALREKYLFTPNNPYGAFAIDPPYLKYINKRAMPKGWTPPEDTTIIPGKLEVSVPHTFA